MKALSIHKAIYILPLVLAGAALMQAEDVVVNPVSVTTADGGQYNPAAGAIAGRHQPTWSGLSGRRCGKSFGRPRGKQFHERITDWNTYFAGNPRHIWVTLKSVRPRYPPDQEFEWFSGRV